MRFPYNKNTCHALLTEKTLNTVIKNTSTNFSKHFTENISRELLYTLLEKIVLPILLISIIPIVANTFLVLIL